MTIRFFRQRNKSDPLDVVYVAVVCGSKNCYFIGFRPRPAFGWPRIEMWVNS